jgi:hypothetical protein
MVVCLLKTLTMGDDVELMVCVCVCVCLLW